MQLDKNLISQNMTRIMMGPDEEVDNFYSSSPIMILVASLLIKSKRSCLHLVIKPPLAKCLVCLEHALSLIRTCFEYDLSKNFVLLALACSMYILIGRQTQSSLIVVCVKMTLGCDYLQA